MNKIRRINIILSLIGILIVFFAGNASATCGGEQKLCTCFPNTWCPNTQTVCISPCKDSNGNIIGYESCSYQPPGCTCAISPCSSGSTTRPCGNCIPSGCGFTALPLEKKFVIGNKTSDEIQQFFLRSAQFSRSTMTAENDLSRATSVVRKENSSVVSDRKTFLASIFEPSLKTIRNFLSRIFFYRS